MTQDEEWREYARCAGLDTETFYPPRDGGVYMQIAGQSKAVCRGDRTHGPCPVIVDCLQYALDRGEPHGIWGGLSHRERNALYRKEALPAFLTYHGRSIDLGQHQENRTCEEGEVLGA